MILCSKGTKIKGKVRFRAKWLGRATWSLSKGPEAFLDASPCGDEKERRGCERL
jgi:hypothetical protein